jgi:hypothetical protein
MAKFKTVIVAVNGIQYPDTATPQTLAYRGYATPVGQIFNGYATPVGQVFNGYATPTGLISGSQLLDTSVQSSKLATPFFGYATPIGGTTVTSRLWILGL